MSKKIFSKLVCGCLVLTAICTNTIAHPDKHITTDPTSSNFLLIPAQQANSNNQSGSSNGLLPSKQNDKPKVNVEVKKQEVPFVVMYKLNAISMVGNKYRASINNIWLEKGQFYSGIEVMDIKSDRVLVMKDNKIYELSISKKQSVFELKNNSQELNEVVGDEYE